uniref:Reverse transcriptase domain-containing protein n=1 Tax=Cannabis sativa TaxID=3483 RepID=A0A803NVZ1_CANSA
MEDLARLLGFSKVVSVGANGLAGGSCLMWNINVNLVVNYFDDGFFDATVWDFQTQMHWKLFAVYGTPYSCHKEAFWKSLESECSLCQLPRVVIGDLNCICSQEEKVGGRLVSANDTRWLKDFMMNLGCIDLQFIGNKYTWQNKRFSGGLIRERLDRALCSPDWILHYESAGVRNLPISISDHGPIIFDTHLFAARGYIPFRFFEAWSWEASCKEEISKVWSMDGTNATAMFIRNISKSKDALQAWKKSIQEINEGEIKNLKQRLEWIQSQPISDALKEEESNLQSQILLSWSKLESMWRQKSRETWLSLGDRNTRFFHAATVIRKRRNSIWAIKDNEGRIWKEKKTIASVINAHFSNLYTSSQLCLDVEFDGLFTNRIDSFANDNLVKVPTKEEIKDVVFCLHPLKAPGPDVKEFFANGILEPRLNSTFICLISKVEFPLSVDYFRPISLCNFSYKVIAKILSNRLRPLMNDLISPFQSAFIPGRWIADSSILTQEIIHKIRCKKDLGGLMALKLDMYKAYDKMEWSFLNNVLCANGFSDKSRNLLMACVTSVSYAVLLNGCPLKKLTPQRGLCQGDPLSPFLFLLCQEVLSKLISKAEVQGLIHGIKIAHSTIPVSHLMFADDTILFSRANTKEASKLMDCISTYEKWSGQSCSKPESSVLFSKNMSSGLKDNILGILNIDLVRGTLRHLGNPFVFKRRKKEDYKRLKDSMFNKLEGWKMKLISYAGRLTLIKSVTSSMPIYVMSTTKIPLSNGRELDALMRKYWWLGNVEKNRFLALKAWDWICQLKASGGLGVRRCEDMNKALLTNKSSDSYQWKCILDTRTTILRGSVSVAAMGNSIDFWHQPWIPWMPSPYQDQMYWKSSPKGMFSVKAAYCVDQFWRFAPVKNIWKWIWEVGIHPRILVLLWRVLNDAIPTKNRLHFLNEKTCNLCEVEEENPLHLFFNCSFSRAIWFGGIVSIKAQHHSGDNLICIVEELVSTFSSSASGVSRCLLLNYIGCVFDAIWNKRNAFCIKNVHVSPSLALTIAGKKFFELQNIPFRKDLDGYEHTVDNMRNDVILVPAIKQVFHVLLTDASWVRGEARLAAISVNMSSGCWCVKSQKLQASSPLEGELRAILHALNWAVESGWEEVLILSDSKVAIQALSSAEFINRTLNAFADGVAKNARVASDLAILYQGEGILLVIPIHFLN